MSALSCFNVMLIATASFTPPALVLKRISTVPVSVSRFTSYNPNFHRVNACTALIQTFDGNIVELNNYKWWYTYTTAPVVLYNCQQNLDLRLLLI